MELLLSLEQIIKSVAPNMTEIIGTRVTSKLVAKVGGVEELAKIPASNIQVIGSERVG